MSQLSITDKVVTMSSLEIAELTKKDHGDVLKDIRNQLYTGLYSVEFDKGKILYPSIQGLTVVIDNHTKRTKEILLDRYHADILVSGYEVKYRAAIIKRWHELEAKQPMVLPDFTNPAIAARAWADEVEQKMIALQKIEADKPKVEFAERVRNMEGACSVGNFAKAIGMGRNRFFRKLREDGILMKNNLPYQHYIDDSRFVVIEQTPFTDSNGKSHPAFTTYITGKGQVWLEKKYRIDNQSNQ